DNSGNGSLNNAVVAIDVNDYGVYAGGFFTDVKNPGGALNNADYITHWNGGAWEALSSNGAGNGSLNFPVLSLAHTGFGTDTLVYVGGQFNDVKYGITTLSNADFVARWEPDSSAWETIPGAPALNAYVHSISISGSSILLGGSFTNAAGLAEADYAALWNGSAWTALGSDGAGDGSLDQAVRATAIKNGKYYVGGHFALESNGTPMPDADYFAIWNGSAWNSAGGYNGSFFYSNMLTMASSGSQVYFGGSVTNFYNNGTYNPNADSVFRWDGTAWNHLGAGDFEESSILDIAINGSDIYVVGSFQNGAGIPEADYIAKWDGVAWSALGSDGMGDGALKGSINALLVSGSEVYVGGNFIDAAGIPNANYIAKWNGSAWSAVGSASAINASVLALEKIGNTLYAGGNFLNAGGVAGADYLAKFDGTNWSTVGSNPLILGSVYTLAALNNDLYVGGSFLVSGIPGAENIAKFDGANWSALDSGLTAPVYSIAAAGTNIYAGGTFTNAGGVPAADYIAKWDGANWSALGSNGAGDGSLNSWVEAVEIANGRVYVAGPFANVNNNGTALNAADYVAAFVVDTTAPTVTSITRASANPTTAASVDFEVTFSESVTNVGTADFSLGKTGGVSGEGITSVSGSGTLYTVTVNTGTGAGTLRLDIPDTSAITDATGNTLAGLPYTSGPSYSIRTQTFADVPTNHWAWNYIERLYSAGITGGCTITPLNYCPTQSVTRAQMAVFLLVASHGSGYVPPAPSGIFADVPVGNPYAAWVEQLANEGITGGCGGNNYCPNSPVTRRQMAVFLLVAEHGSGYTPPAATGMFADVPVNDPFAAWIEQLANEGITGGCGGGNYCPTLSVNRGQMAVFLVKTFNLP
ncbi:MAG: S-layer homology domain-containing protein, partial [Chloroflexota bacterium]